MTRRALVLGGTGAVGRAVVTALRDAGVDVTFTYRRSREVAAELGARGATSVEVDLADPEAVAGLLGALAPVDVLVTCAVAPPGAAFVDEREADWRAAFAVNVDATAAACRWFARTATTGDIVLVGGLDRGQSLPLPPSYAASQGALAALAMALGHELGARIRVNLVALGVLDAGVSRQLSAARRKDYQAFSALRREGTPAEAAKVICYLALENRYVQGKVVAANGGI